MLTLSRQVGQKILIDTSDGEIVIVVKSTSGSRVSLAIGAPKVCHIHREETAAKHRKAMQEASTGVGSKHQHSG